MRKRITNTLIVTLLGCMGGFACPASAGLIASLNNEGSTTLHEITVNPSDTFAVNLNIATDGRVYWLSLGGTGGIRASASGVFDITGGGYVDPWAQFGTRPFPLGGLDPDSALLVAVTSPFFGPGSGTVAHMGLAVDAGAAPGTYTLTIPEVWYYGSLIVPEATPGDAGPDFVVHVVPEPGTFVLVFAAFALATRRFR